jgi:hypothetical protein
MEGGGYHFFGVRAWELRQKAATKPAFTQALLE